MKFLSNLTELMNEKKINRTELAKEIGIAPSTINNWYNRGCGNISLQTLLKLSNFFNISIEELVNGNCNIVIFNNEDYSITELKAIRNFSKFLKTTREEIEAEMKEKSINE